MKKLLFAFALVAVTLGGCKKDEEVEAKDQPMNEYVLGDWNFYKVNLTGQIFTFNLTGTGKNVSGKWTFKNDGTVRAEVKYEMDIMANGQVLDSETADEVIIGTYTTTATTVTVIADGETTTYQVANRENTSFDLKFSEVINEGGFTGNLDFTIGLRR